MLGKLGLGEVLDHREAHRLWHPEAELRRVADVDLDDLVPLTLELEGAGGERAADVVADVFEVTRAPKLLVGHGGGLQRRARGGKRASVSRRRRAGRSASSRAG